MPWEGYNYEDAIIINEQIVYKDYLTSIHIEEAETNLTYGLTGSEKLTKAALVVYSQFNYLQKKSKNSS